MGYRPGAMWLQRLNRRPMGWPFAIACSIPAILTLLAVTIPEVSGAIAITIVCLWLTAALGWLFRAINFVTPDRRMWRSLLIGPGILIATMLVIMSGIPKTVWNMLR